MKYRGKFLCTRSRETASPAASSRKYDRRFSRAVCNAIVKINAKQLSVVNYKAIKSYCSRKGVKVRAPYKHVLRH